MTALFNRNFNDVRGDSEVWGRLVEVAVGSHLANDASKTGLEVYYWREGNTEVDYVLRKGKELIAIEVKSGKRMSSLAGLATFVKRFKGAKTLVVGPGGIDLEQFLATPVSKWF